MAVCGLRTLLLIVCVLQLIGTIERQTFDFLGYMWLPIIVNFINILLIIFGSFGAVQCVTKYLLAYSLWSTMWLTWNIFLICYYLNIGFLNRESGLLSLGTGSVSWWEGNGWGCQPVWGEVDGPGTWRPVKVDGCMVQWHYIELAQSVLATTLTILALPLAIMLTLQLFRKTKPSADKGTLSRRPVYTIELSPTETNNSENSLKPMTPRRVKRRSGSRGNNSSIRRSRRSYRNAGYMASNASLPRENRASRPTSAHSSYSNFHAARPASYHAPERDPMSRSQETYEPSPPPPDSIPINTNRYDTIRRNKVNGYDVVGPYNDNERGYERTRAYEKNVPTYDNMNRAYEMTSTNYESREDGICSQEAGYGGYGGGGYAERAWDTPPPPAPPYSARATPQAPGPPAYQPNVDSYNMP